VWADVCACVSVCVCVCARALDVEVGGSVFSCVVVFLLLMLLKSHECECARRGGECGRMCVCVSVFYLSYPKSQRWVLCFYHVHAA
jgi:hypothetical protein